MTKSKKTIYNNGEYDIINNSTGDIGKGNKWITVNPYLFLRGVKVSNWVSNFYYNSEWAKIERQHIKVIPRDNKENE